MARTVPNFFTVNPGDPITSTYWNDNVVGVNGYLSNRPTFKGVCSTGPTIASSTNWTRIPLDTTLIDTDSGHSNTVNNSRYTCQVQGIYWTTGIVAFSSTGSAGRFDSVIAVNSTIIEGSGTFLTRLAATAQRQVASALVFLNVGDFVEIWGRQNSGANAVLDTGAAGTAEPAFNVMWIGI